MQMKWRHAINAALGGVVLALALARLGWWPADAAPVAFAAGRPVGAPEVAEIARSGRTVFLVLRSDCGFCTASMDFYKRLAASDPLRTGRVQLAMGGPEPPPVLARYAGNYGLTVQRVVKLPLDGIRGTPTLAVVGSDGVVEATWVGKLHPVVEQEVFALLDTPGRSEPRQPGLGGM